MLKVVISLIGVASTTSKLHVEPKLALMIIPSLLYLVQNNLIYMALQYLQPAVFQVVYQLKIVFAAIMAWVVFKRGLPARQWSAMILLLAGILLVSTENLPQNAGLLLVVSILSSFAISGEHRQLWGCLALGTLLGSIVLCCQRPAENQNQMVGVAYTLVSAFISGCTGTLTEYMFKTCQSSFWVQSMTLAASSTVLGLAYCLLGADRELIRSKGFFVGYDGIVWSLVVLQAVGGFLVGVILKYADNVSKGFAGSIAIIISVCVYQTHYPPNLILAIALVSDALVTLQ
mmetsp:Transcript_9901/g.18658  ORF Transcript_9901/g.18658 Transcript_9901/m.18658 type:complete len:288 (-) Transcript_9901:854-1717(-)